MALSIASELDVAFCLAEVEAHLGALDEALVSGDADRIDAQSRQLQQCLAGSLAALRHGDASALPAQLIQRLTLARTRCMQQQQAVHRATASFGRTLGALFPGEDTTFSPPSTSIAGRALRAYR
jgi:hypothetical protein